MSRRFRLGWLLLAPLVLALLGVAGMLFLLQGGFEPLRVPHARAAMAGSAEEIARGEYLARLGNCRACHTARGGAAFAGGRAFGTPYGTLYSSNITPDVATGIGDWSLEEFRHTLQHGVSRRGLLYPVFPYENFARLDPADVDALFVYLRSLPPVTQAALDNALDFPANRRGAVLLWRMWNYRPAPFVRDATQTAEWNRGRYLVDALGHCEFCHGTRGALAVANSTYLGGSVIPGSGWYAPPLDAAGLARYSREDLADYLRAGTSTHGAAYGPMAAVVRDGLQHLTEADALATAVYLKSLRAASAAKPVYDRQREIGARQIEGLHLYEKFCADCHASDGRGKDQRYPSLRGAVAITAADPINAARVLLYGGVGPSTAQNPRPYSMPPFVQQLTPGQSAAILNYVRGAWGGQPATLSAADVVRMQGIVLE